MSGDCDCLTLVDELLESLQKQKYQELLKTLSYAREIEQQPSALVEFALKKMQDDAHLKVVVLQHKCDALIEALRLARMHRKER